MRKQHDYTECYERPCDPCDRAAHSLTDEEYEAAKAVQKLKQEPLTRNILVGLSMEGFMNLGLQKRKRASNAELYELRERIVRIAHEFNPLSVRNLFYQLTGDDGSGVFIEKSEAAYRQVMRLKKQLCRARAIPWHFFSDSSRFAYDNDGFEGLDDAEFVDRVASMYRRNYWSTTSIYPQLWVESRSLTPTLAGTARALGVSLYPSGGMASDTFVYGAAAEAVHTGRESMVVLYVGDYDPSGLQIADSLETKIGEHLGFAAEDYGMDAPTLTFQRVAITPQQIVDYALPTKPVKATQSRKRYDIADTVEAEAMRPDTMRSIVADAFEPMIDRAALERLRTIEAAERHGLRARLLELGYGV